MNPDLAPAQHDSARATTRIGLKETPFAPRLRPLNQFEALEYWQGYWSPAHFGNMEREYFAIRNTASVFDISPMNKYRITGPDADAFLQRLVTRDVTKISVGRVAYTVWCDDAGQVIDDGTLFHLGEQDWRLCCQEHQTFWLEASARGFDVSVREETEEVAGLSLQGPTSFSVLSRLGLGGLETLKPFGIRRWPFRGHELMVSRTGFTGDLGYELWIAPSGALDLWDALMEAGQGIGGVEPTGSHALNMARIEAGFLGAQLDFIPADKAIRAGRTRSPYELNLGWLVDLAKGQFTGRKALVEEKARGSRYCLVAVDIEGKEPAEGSLVYHKQKTEVGHITSGIWSPTAKRNIGLASLKRPFGDTKTEDLWVEIYALHELRWEKVMARVRVVKAPFFEPARRRATPPLPF
jgi:aminomethyltransferase